MAGYSLQDLERDYYLGSYQTCINKASSMLARADSIYYLCLSYKSMNKKDNLERELSKTSSMNDDEDWTFVKVLSSHKKGNESNFDHKSIHEDDERSRLLLSGTYASRREFVKALQLIDHFNTLRSSHAKITVYILMNRTDLAEKQLLKMQKIDEQNPITEVTEAMLLLAKGNPDQAWRLAQSLSERYKPTPLLNNIQTAAALCLSDYDNAKTLCESSLDMDNDNVEALINMIHILSKSHSQKQASLIERNLERLMDLNPDHDYLKALDSITADMATY